MIKHLNVCLLLLLVGACNSNDSITKTLTVNKQDSITSPVVFSIDFSTVKNNSKKILLNFLYHDSIAYGHPFNIIRNGTKLLLNSPTQLFYNLGSQPIFLIYPGEKILIKYAGTDTLQMVIDNNLQRTNELNFFRILAQKTGSIYNGGYNDPFYLKEVKTLNDVHSFEKKIGETREARMNLLDSFANKSLISNDFKKIAFNSIISAALNDSLLLYFHNRGLLSQPVFRELLSEKLITIKKIEFAPFQLYLNTCQTVLSLLTTNFPHYIIQNSDDFIKRFNFIVKNFQGITKDFLLCNTLFTAYTNAIPVPKEYLSQFNDECKNEVYKNIVSKKLSDDKTIAYPAGNNNLMFTNGKTVQDIQTIISRYKGNIILLDFWASWCVPCRAEMPYADTLKQKYNNQNVSFVYISTDNNVDSWLKANAEEDLDKDHSFLFLRSYESSFAKQYGINSIPRYILIGKDGKIINADAPRPSDPKLKELIEKYLKD